VRWAGRATPKPADLRDARQQARAEWRSEIHQAQALLAASGHK